MVITLLAMRCHKTAFWPQVVLDTTAASWRIGPGRRRGWTSVVIGLTVL
jgi:hypothetical protein